MQAWLCENPVGVDALQWKELPTPTPGPGEVLIAIEAASLNFPDLLIVQNKYQMKPPLPFVPGTELSGVVTEVGDGVKGFAVGQRVAAFGAKVTKPGHATDWGGYSGYFTDLDGFLWEVAWNPKWPVAED